MPHEYICHSCEKPFTSKVPLHSAHVFCSRPCYWESRKSGSEITCERCGQKVYRTATRIARGERFCSSECMMAERSAGAVEKVCPVCAKSFSTKASQAGRYTVCSIECRLATTKYVECKRCGKKFTGERHRNRPYCSEECRRPPVFINCQNCNIEFRIVPGAINRRYCSFSCYRRSQGETIPERRIREALTLANYQFIQEARMGRYSVDFLLPELRIALEVDGVYWHKDTERDARKTRFLNTNGWNVLRITDLEIEHVSDLSAFLVARLQLTPR